MDAARGLCGAGGRAAQEEVIRRAGPRSRACWQEGRAARVRPLPRTSTLMVHEAWSVSTHVSTRVPRPAESSMYTTACVAWSVAPPLSIHFVTAQREAAEDQLARSRFCGGAAALAPLRRWPTRRRPQRQHRRSGDHDRRPKSHHRRGRSRLLGHSRSAWWTMGFSAASAVARTAPCVQQGTALRH